MHTIRRNPSLPQTPKVEEIYQFCESALTYSFRGTFAPAERLLVRAKDAITLYILVTRRLDPDKADSAHAILFGVLGKTRQGVNKHTKLFNSLSVSDQAGRLLGSLGIDYEQDGDLFVFCIGSTPYRLSATDTISHIRLRGF
jgi:hypothetical protein